MGTISKVHLAVFSLSKNIYDIYPEIILIGLDCEMFDVDIQESSQNVITYACIVVKVPLAYPGAFHKRFGSGGGEGGGGLACDENNDPTLTDPRFWKGKRSKRFLRTIEKGVNKIENQTNFMSNYLWN